MAANWSENENYSNICDELFVVAALLGVEKAFAVLARKYSGAMFTVARRICRSTACAEDAVQESLLIAHRSLSTLKNPARFGSWLHSITRNSAIRLNRNACKTELVPFGDGEPLLVQLSERTFRELQERWAQNERAAQLKRAVAQLPDEFRELLDLRFWCEMRISDIADFTALPESTVKWRIHRAKAILREIITQEE